MNPAAPQSILVVDDTPANVVLLERMLTERGYIIRSASNGTMAMEAARAEPPDLILLDIAMPGLSGYEVCGQLKLDPALKHIPVIFISILHETIDKVIAFSVGGVDYVTKPFQFEEVFARVQTHLQLRRLEQLRDELTRMFVHDLQHPLTAVFDFLDLLKVQDEQRLSANTQIQVAAARQSASDMMALIARSLNITPDTTQPTISATPVTSATPATSATPIGKEGP